MMKQIYFAILLLCGLSLSGTSVIARSIEVKSENFVLVGNVSQGDGKKLVLELEQYRQAVLQLLGVDTRPEPVRVRIYTAQSSDALQSMTGRSDIGGVYTSNIEGPIFMLNSQGGFRRIKRGARSSRSKQGGSQGRYIALHEYTHHLLAAYSDQIYPRWYGEGFANYLATFEVNRKGDFVIGMPYQPYAYALSEKKWMSGKRVFGAIRKYPFVANSGSNTQIDAGDFFYAQSWLAAHFLHSNPAEAKNISKYISLLNSENKPENLFEEAFGRSMQDFQIELKAYYKKNLYNVSTITPQKIIGESSLQIRKLSDGEALFHKAEAMRHFRISTVSTQQIIDQYKLAAKKMGQTPGILLGLAELATWKDDFELAKTYIDKALSIAPEDTKVNHMAGMILVYKNEDQEANMEELKQARKYLMKALRQDSNNMSAHFYYAKSYGLTNAKPSAQGYASAETALDYYRSVNFIDSNVMLADVLLRDQKVDFVRPILDKAVIWGSGNASYHARELRNYLGNSEE